MEQIIELRNDPLEGEYYMDLLDNLLKAVVGATKFKENRCKRCLSEWFTITNEAFLLLCFKNCRKQLHFKWMVKTNGPPANEACAHEVMNRLFTCKTRGSKRSWSRERMERFNNLTVLVYNDRRERGKDFDQWFLWEMNHMAIKIKMLGGK
jgi:hypothetical protein